MAQIILNHIDIEIWNKRHVQFQPHDGNVNIIAQNQQVERPHS